MSDIVGAEPRPSCHLNRPANEVLRAGGEVPYRSRCRRRASGARSCPAVPLPAPFYVLSVDPL